MTVPSTYANGLPPGWGAASDCRDTLWADLDSSHPQIAADCRARAERFAAEHDGQGIDPLCGRQWLAEAYQELLDAVTYLRLEALRIRALVRVGESVGERLRHVQQMEASTVRLTQWCLSVLQEEDA